MMGRCGGRVARGCATLVAAGVVLVALVGLACAETPEGARISMLRSHPKLNRADRVLEAFEGGAAETAVIVRLQPTAESTALSAQSRASARIPAEFNKPSAPPFFDLQDESVRSQLHASVREHVGRVVDRLDPAGMRVGKRFSYQFGFAAKVTPEALERLLAMPEVLAVEEDGVVESHLAQGIPLMNGTAARSTYTGAGVSIAICDTGIDTSHPSLGGGAFPNGKVIGGYDFGDNDADPRPDPYAGSAHGTACAGIAAGYAGAHGDYIGGVAPAAKLYSLKIESDDGTAYFSSIISGWEWAIAHKNDDPSNPILIISTSFGGGQYSSACDSSNGSFATAAANAVAAGITVFASAGNNGYCGSMQMPACLSNVNSVGAAYDADIGTQSPCVSYLSCASKLVASSCSTGWYVRDTSAADKVTAYSNSASFLTLFAPSDNAYAPDIVGSGGYSDGDYDAEFGGTSAACPYAAGAAAVLQQAAKAKTGSYLTPAQVRSYLTSNGDSVTDWKASVTKPRINLGRAVDAIAAGPAKPNLVPYKPGALGDKLVVSKTTSGTSDSSPLYATDTLYLTGAVLNDSDLSVTGSFTTTVRVDGAVVNAATISPLSAHSYNYYASGLGIGTLAAGTHTITVTVDSAGVIAESSETDNSYARSVVVLPAIYAIGGTVRSGTLTGPAVSGATVTLAGKTATTDASGAFQITGISAGAYPLTISAPGYATYSNAAYQVAGNQAAADFALVPAAADQSVLFSSGFEPGDAWSTAQAFGYGTWSIVTIDSFVSAAPHGGSKMASFNSFSASSGTQTRLYRSTGFAVPADAESVTLSFWMYHDSSYSTTRDRIQPQVSVDGATWSNVGTEVVRYRASAGWEKVSVDISAFRGSSNLRLGFLGISAYGTNQLIDDVWVASVVDATKPTVLSTEPASGATVGVQAVVQAVFSEPMDPASINASSFTVQGSAGAVSGTVSYEPTTRTATFTPSGALGYGARYGATVGVAARDAAGNPLAEAKSWSFTTSDPSRISVAITGSGSVSSTPAGIACSGGNLGTCTGEFPLGTDVVLTPSPQPGKIFFRWSADCTSYSGNNCIVSVTGAHSVSASFFDSPAVYVLPLGGFYDSLQGGYSAALTPSTIEARDMAFAGDLVLDKGKVILLKGGYDSAYETDGGYTVVDGMLEVRTGRLTVRNVKVR